MRIPLRHKGIYHLETHSRAERSCSQQTEPNCPWKLLSMYIPLLSQTQTSLMDHLLALTQHYQTHSTIWTPAPEHCSTSTKTVNGQKGSLDQGQGHHVRRITHTLKSHYQHVVYRIVREDRSVLTCQKRQCDRLSVRSRR